MKLLAAIAAIAFSSVCCAESLEQPPIHAGDSWIYRMTTERGPSGWVQTRDEIVVSRATPSTIYFSQKQVGSTQPVKEVYSGLDWSRIRDVNGKETKVAQLLNFPLSVGKEWALDYTEQHPSKNFKSESWTSKYTVVGYEDIEVPAGKFHALKIEAEGRWTAELEPNQSVVQTAQTSPDGVSMATDVKKTGPNQMVTGRIYKASWYVPEVKRWVKSVEEYYGSGGARNERYTTELESFKPAAGQP